MVIVGQASLLLFSHLSVGRFCQLSSSRSLESTRWCLVLWGGQRTRWLNLARVGAKSAPLVHDLPVRWCCCFAALLLDSPGPSAMSSKACHVC